MTDQNIKFKTSMAPIIPGQTEDKTDSYELTKNDKEMPSFGPDNSNYEPENPKNANWRQVSGGTTAKYAINLPTQEDSGIGAIANWCSNVNTMKANHIDPYRPANQPKNAADVFLNRYQPYDYTKQFDLKESVPNIPPAAELYQEIEDVDFVRNYYNNRLDLLDELIANTQKEIASPIDSNALRARQEFLVFLQGKKAYVKEQLKELKTIEASLEVSA